MIKETKTSYVCTIDGLKFSYSKKGFGIYAKNLAELSENTKIYYKNFIIDCENGISIIKLFSKTFGYNDVYIDTKNKDKITSFKWRTKKDDNHNTLYCISDKFINKKRFSIQLHRIIVNCPDNKIVDHKDRNGLNNLESNLRITDISLNGKNSRKQKNNKSDLPTCVYYNNKEKCFRVFWSENKKSFGRTLYINKHGGYEKTKKKAILLRYEKCKENDYDMSDIEEARRNLLRFIKIKKLI